MSFRRITDFSAITCLHSLCLADVLKKLDPSDYKFLIIVDDEQHVVGTITDGDIRRALLKGCDMSSLAPDIMRTKPIIARQADNEDHCLQLLAQTGAKRPFLPILDEQEHLIEILIHAEDQDPVFSALIMAGGKGTRLGELTANTPKPLLEVGSRPLIEHAIEMLEKAKVDKIYIAVHHMAEQFEAFIQARPDSEKIELIYETEAIGTAGAISLLPKDISGHLMVMNADVLTNVDLRFMQRFHEDHGNSATIAVANYEHQVPFGVIQKNEAGLFTGMDEKPKVHFFVSAGIYCLSPEITKLVSQNQHTNMPEVLQKARELGMNVGLFPIHEYWTDVGRPHDFVDANAKYMGREI